MNQPYSDMQTIVDEMRRAYNQARTARFRNFLDTRTEMLRLHRQLAVIVPVLRLLKSFCQVDVKIDSAGRLQRISNYSDICAFGGLVRHVCRHNLDAEMLYPQIIDLPIPVVLNPGTVEETITPGVTLRNLIDEFKSAILVKKNAREKLYQRLISTLTPEQRGLVSKIAEYDDAKSMTIRCKSLENVSFQEKLDA